MAADLAPACYLLTQADRFSFFYPATPSSKSSAARAEASTTTVRSAPSGTQRVFDLPQDGQDTWTVTASRSRRGSRRSSKSHTSKADPHSQRVRLPLPSRSAALVLA